MPHADTAEDISQRINRLGPGAALILRSGPLSAFTRVFDALWDRVSKDGGAPLIRFYTLTRPALALLPLPVGERVGVRGSETHR